MSTFEFGTWYPIESVGEYDKRVVLIWVPSRQTTFLVSSRSYGSDYPKDDGDLGYWTAGYSGAPATHWMPPPDGPAEPELAQLEEPVSSSKETIYDEEIAPVLKALSERCRDTGMPFIALVGYDDEGSVGRTLGYPAGSMTTYFQVLHIAAQCREDDGGFNVDRLCLGLKELFRGKPHGSIFLANMGLPPAPKP